MNIKAHIPNFFTLLNLALGFVAILMNDPFWSPVLILIASFADLLDGLLARVLNVRSDLGAQLDSFADLVSFGIAPAFLYYHHVMSPDWISMILICFIPVFATLRLAIFNLDDSQNYSFRGLPSPANGLFFAFLVYDWANHSIMELDWVNKVIPLIFAFIMLSPFSMFSLKGISQKPAFEKGIIGLLALIAIVLIIWKHLSAIPLIVLAYLVLSMINNLFRKK